MVCNSLWRMKLSPTRELRLARLHYETALFCWLRASVLGERIDTLAITASALFFDEVRRSDHFRTRFGPAQPLR